MFSTILALLFLVKDFVFVKFKNETSSMICKVWLNEEWKCR